MNIYNSFLWERDRFVSIFREYDVRGIVGKDLTPDVAQSIGRAYGTMARQRECRTVALGRDGRLTSPELRDLVLAGITTTGVNVVDIGVCPTPLLYFSLYELPVDGGVMVTGSHNAAEYNGFKMCLGKAALYGEDIQELKRLIETGSYASGSGTVSTASVIPPYLRYLKEHFAGLDGKGMHVVVDCGNGAASLVARDALEQLGCRVTGLYDDLDGRFPNHHPDPTVVENLQDLIQAVKLNRADVGIAYDGDADRIGTIDEKGTIIWGDRLLLIFARDLLKDRPGSTVISDTKASECLYEDIRKRGGNGIMWKTGHSVMKAKMKEEEAALAGEISGHMFFADRYFGYDDAIYASCRLIEILLKAQAPFSSLLADLPSTQVTPEIRMECPDDVKFQVVETIRNRLVEAARQHNSPNAHNPGPAIREVITIDGVRVCFDDGWGLIRASNTQPALVLRFEATSAERLQAIRTYLEGELEACTRSGAP